MTRDAGPVAGTRWLSAEEQYLRKHGANADDYLLAAEIGRSPRAVKHRRLRLGVKQRCCVPWTDVELTALRGCTTLSEARSRLPAKPYTSILSKAAQLGVVLARQDRTGWSTDDIATLKACKTWLDARATLPHKTRWQIRYALQLYGHGLPWPKGRPLRAFKALTQTASTARAPR